jgi:hypothetical protein
VLERRLQREQGREAVARPGALMMGWILFEQTARFIYQETQAPAQVPFSHRQRTSQCTDEDEHAA